MTATAMSFAAAPGIDPGVFVLHGRRLRPGVTLAGTARFGDDVWRLNPALLQSHHSGLLLDFTNVPAEHRATCKELCYALLSGPLPPGEQRHSLDTVRAMHVGLRRFFGWLHTHHPGSPVVELREQALLDYRRHLQLVLPGHHARCKALGAVRLLWRYRQALPGDRLAFDPGQLDGWDERAALGAENATDRIPEQVLTPLITWCIRFVDEFAADILTANQLIPGTVAGRRQAARELGLAPGTQLETRITATLDGQPWIPRVETHPRHPHSLARLCRHLQCACYVLIAYLSGMRDAEIKHLQRGCVRVERDSTGAAYRWTVTSRAFKGEPDPTGADATWVIGHPAARAINVLEQLQPAGQDWLFAVLRNGYAASAPARSTATTLTGAGTLFQLNDFLSWINAYCAELGRPDAIPQVNGKAWRLNTRQFRRTLAWFIARHPGGAIAGALQYRHLSVQMFEGYAGTSDSGFRAEVEAEQALTRGEHLLELTDQHTHHDLAGPAAADAAHRLETFAERARFSGTVITDRRRLARVMRRHDPAIYPDTYVTCVFNPDKALCLKHTDNSRRPRLSQCQPLQCPNVALTTDNIAALRRELEHVDTQLAARPGPPPLLAHRLSQRRTAITGFLDQHTQEGT